MRVLIIGASGFIGHHLRRRLTQNADFEVTGTYNARAPEDIDDSWYALEITDHHRLDQIFQRVMPEVVVLLAAMADVKTAETNPERATNVNVNGARNVSRLCTEYNARLVFLSSEYVFKGDLGNYKEDEEPNPDTQYGRTKWQAEIAIAEEACDWSIIRTSVVFGWPITGRRNIATAIIDRLRDGKTFEGDASTYRSPIYVDHLTEGIAQLIKDYQPGTFHIAGTDWMNMYQFGLAVAKVFELDNTLVTQVPTSPDLPSKNAAPEGIVQAPRPDILGLNCNRTTQMLRLPTFSVVSGLRDMLVSFGT